MARLIKVLDTSLRDGEQAPGYSLSLRDKIEVAKQLELLKVDIIEAGFAVISKGDFEAVKAISQMIKDCTVASLCRAVRGDIDAAWEALQNACDPFFNIVIATSDLHMRYKLKKTPDEVVEQAIDAVKYAKQYCNNVEFSCEDATRSNKAFLYRIFTETIKAGATVINLPDTVGYFTPDEMEDLVYSIRNNVPGADKVEISVHCHNDLGMGVANTLSAVVAGANQVECTLNGIGERAGNASLEEIVMALKTRKDFFNVETRIDTTKIYKASKVLSNATGVRIPPNKPIVGKNAFAHESGIHQHGVIANPQTYEIMRPQEIGLVSSKMVLGKHSGRHAVEDLISEMGYVLSKPALDMLFEKFKKIADKKEAVSYQDIESLVSEFKTKGEAVYTLESFLISTGNTVPSMAVVTLKNNEGQEVKKVSLGDGPIDAAFNAIDSIVGMEYNLKEYSIEAVTGGKDALGEVKVKIQKGEKVFVGNGLSTDTIEASLLAYINAINNMIHFLKSQRVE